MEHILNVVDNTEEIEEVLKEGVAGVLWIDYEIKKLQEQKKNLKKDLKQKGVNLKLLNKIVSNLKRMYKENKDEDNAEVSLRVEKYMNDEDIKDILYKIYEEKE